MDNDEDKSQLSLSLDADAQEKKLEVEDSASERSLEWICHPAKKNMKITIFVSIFIAALIVVIYFVTYSPWFCVLGFLILFGSLSSFYFPTHYRLTEKEIRIKTKTQTLVKKWSQFRTVYPDKNGVLLSPFVRPSRLENFRGLYIKFWYNKDEVVGFVREQIEKAKTQE